MPPSLRLGKYIVEGLLGPGGVTETYLARLADDVACGAGQAERLFALKLLRSDRIPAGFFARVAQRFVSVGRQLRGFHRPGFAKVIDVCDDPAATFIVSDHVAGRDLAGLLALRQAELGAQAGDPIGLDPVLAGLLGSEIARLLQVAHSAKPPFCHLGLAPQNISVTANGEVVLLDMGVAAALRALGEQPVERWLFVAPEWQGRDMGPDGLPDRRGVAADLYALGALLYLLLTGHAPIQAASLEDLQRRRQVPAMAGIPGKLAAALRTMLAPDPDERPESAAMLVDWLAGGVETTHERQHFIAEATRAMENGAALAAAVGPSSAPVDQALRILPPGSAGEHGAGGEGEGMTGGLAKPRALPPKAAVMAGVGVAVLVLLAVVMTRLPAPKQAREAAADDDQAVAKQAALPTVASPAGVATSALPSAEPGGSSVAGHLIADTAPPGAWLWVDGAYAGKTFVDAVVGGGSHRVVLFAPGHRMFRSVVDTTSGAIIRRTLPSVVPVDGDGIIQVACHTHGQFPVFVDDQETGQLCPTQRIAAALGKHTVGIFLIAQNRMMTVETTAQRQEPAVVVFRE